MIFEIELFIIGFLIGMLLTWLYDEAKDRMNDKIRVAIRDEKIRCLERKIKELENDS